MGLSAPGERPAKLHPEQQQRISTTALQYILATGRAQLIWGSGDLDF